MKDVGLHIEAATARLHGPRTKPSLDSFVHSAVGCSEQTLTFA